MYVLCVWTHREKRLIILYSITTRKETSAKTEKRKKPI